MSINGSESLIVAKVAWHGRWIIGWTVRSRRKRVWMGESMDWSGVGCGVVMGDWGYICLDKVG
jgi:hypothetical protein